jgi:hypothetical protein
VTPLLRYRASQFGDASEVVGVLLHP